MALFACKVGGSEGMGMKAMPTVDNKYAVVNGQLSAEKGTAFVVEKGITTFKATRTTGGQGGTMHVVIYDKDGVGTTYDLNLTTASTEYSAPVNVENPVFGVAWYNGTLGSQIFSYWFE